MAATQNINIRVDAEVKAQAEAILAELGLPTATAINIFLKSVIRHRGLPLDMMLDSIENPTGYMVAENKTEKCADVSASLASKDQERS